ncbi:MAG: hypothetical protein R3C53_11245 [Pirellulaceae bacterium]
MDINLIAWIGGAALACAILVKMMRQKQLRLSELLRQYVEGQLEWARKRNRAARLAQQAVQQKASLEKEEQSALDRINAETAEATLTQGEQIQRPEQLQSVVQSTSG